MRKNKWEVYSKSNWIGQVEAGTMKEALNLAKIAYPSYKNMEVFPEGRGPDNTPIEQINVRRK